MHETVDHGRCPHCQSHGGNYRRREARVLPQHPHSIARVLDEALQPTHATLVATRLLDGLSPSKLPQRRMARLVGSHPGFEVLLCLHLDVRAHLLVHLMIELALPKYCAKSNFGFS